MSSAVGEVFVVQTPAGHSNDVVLRTWLFRFQLARALAQVGHGVSFKEPYNRVADLLHDTADGAGCFLRTRTLFVIEGAHTAHRRQRALDMPNDRGQGDGFR